MPFVEVLRKDDRVNDQVLKELVPNLTLVVADVLSRLAPSHVVTPEMVDVVVRSVGPLDCVHPDLLVTVLARHEPDRDDKAERIIQEITAAVNECVGGVVAMVELVLTNRTSVFAYRGC